MTRGPGCGRLQAGRNPARPTYGFHLTSKLIGYVDGSAFSTDPVVACSRTGIERRRVRVACAVSAESGCRVSAPRLRLLPHDGEVVAVQRAMVVPRSDQCERTSDGYCGRRSRRAAAHLRRLCHERDLEDRRQRQDLAGDLGAHAVDEHRRHRRGAVEPEHRLGRNRRSQHLPRVDAGGRLVQVHRRRSDVAVHGIERHADDRPHPRASVESRCRVRGGVGTRMDRQRDARRLQDHRRRQDVEQGALQEPADRRDRSRHGPAQSRRAVRRHVAARPPQVERPARRARIQGRRRHQDDRRRQDVDGRQSGTAGAGASRAHRHRHLADRDQTRSTRSSTTTRSAAIRSRDRTMRTAGRCRQAPGFIKGADVYRSDDGGKTWRQTSRQDEAMVDLPERIAVRHVRLGLRPDSRRSDQSRHVFISAYLSVSDGGRTFRRSTAA